MQTNTENEEFLVQLTKLFKILGDELVNYTDDYSLFLEPLNNYPTNVTLVENSLIVLCSLVGIPFLRIVTSRLRKC